MPKVPKNLTELALDMSKAARMKRAEKMGFDTSRTWFHGTSGDFNAFDNRYLGGKTTGPTKRLGFHFAADPGVASDYANISDTSQLAESRMKADAIIESFAGADPEKKKELAEALKKQNAITAKLEEKVPPPGEGAKVIPAHLKMKNPLVYDTEGGVLDNYAARIAEMAREDGHDGIVFKNTYDTLWNPDDPSSAKPTEIAIVFDPSQIRSVNAKFNPKDAKSGKILAGGAGAATLAASNEALASDLKSPIKSGMAEIGAQLAEGLKGVDSVIANPFRSFLKSALDGKGIIQSTRDATQSIGGPEVTGEQVAESFLSLSPNQNLGVPVNGKKEYPLAGPLGVAIDMGVDPTNLIGGAGAAKVIEHSPETLKIIEQAIMKRGIPLY